MEPRSVSQETDLAVTHPRTGCALGAASSAEVIEGAVVGNWSSSPLQSESGACAAMRASARRFAFLQLSGANCGFRDNARFYNDQIFNDQI
jgi:hypothetical protein